MIKYSDNTINDWNFGASNIVKVYHNNAVCYYKISGDAPTPTQTPCYAVVDDISQYSDTEFDDVFNKADGNWYKLNNLNQYEKYGVYGSGRAITSYEGKLTIDGDYEYQYSGGSWVNVGEVSGGSISDDYVIPFEDSTVKTICVNNWGGGVVAGELTYGEAKQVTSLGSVFKDNSSISSFNELGYFKGLTNLDNGEFVGCYNLTDIVIPNNVTTLGYDLAERNTFYGCSNLSGITMISSGGSLTINGTANVGSYYMNSSHQNVPMIFPDREITMSNAAFGYYDYLSIVYFQSSTPPANLANADINNYNKLANVYCPVGSLSAYQTALSGKGKTITEYDFETDSLGLLDKEKEWASKTSLQNIYPIYYSEMQKPPDNVSFSSMTEAESYECPWWGMSADIDNIDYMFCESNTWLTKYTYVEVSGDYLCDSGNKYKKMQEYDRLVDGSTSATTNYVIGDLIESGSTDCQRGLPSGYTEVEYIQNYSSTSLGTSYLAYLNTNHTPTENTRTVVDLKIDKATKNPRLFGNGRWDSLGYILNCEETVGSDGKLYYKFGQTSSWYQTSVSVDMLRHVYDFNNNGQLIVDNTNIATLPSTTFTCVYPMALFTATREENDLVDLNETVYGTLYSCQIYDNGTLIRDFVPCIDPNNVVGVYDIVNDVFYGSANGNSFTAGPQV